MELYSGNEALARGAWESGVNVAFGYPGTPSTEILENLVKYPDVYCEWSPNEKVALESAAGAAAAGARALVTMKLVGLNVAADPLMTLSYIGVKGGLVLVIADDPGQHSSQTEQDTRHYARLSKVPVLEPGNAAECRSFMFRAFEISEKYGCPVILRTTTCVSHSRFQVETGERRQHRAEGFVKNPQRWVPLPAWGRILRRKIEVRMVDQAAESSGDTGLNRIYRRGGGYGVISFGVTALHALELFPEADVLKIGWSWPFPDKLLTEFSGGYGKLLLLEEGDPILEEHLKSLGISVTGKEIVPRTGELTPETLLRIKASWDGVQCDLPSPVPEAADLPARPPMLCAGCPHRGVFYALGKFDVVVTGDIGCYSLGVFPPLERTDMLLCMGGGFTLAHGMRKAGESRPVVGVVGDSTFFHSGITGLLNSVYNRDDTTLIVLDNRTTAMTGHQDHPGTGKTLMGEPAFAASIEKIAAACGVKRIFTVDPHHINELVEILKTELYCGEPSLIVSRAPCVLKERNAVKPPLKIDGTLCRNCRACLKLGCPAIEISGSGKPEINSVACVGCGMCRFACKFQAIGDMN